MKMILKLVCIASDAAWFTVWAILQIIGLPVAFVGASLVVLSGIILYPLNQKHARKFWIEFVEMFKYTVKTYKQLFP